MHWNGQEIAIPVNLRTPHAVVQKFLNLSLVNLIFTRFFDEDDLSPKAGCPQTGTGSAFNLLGNLSGINDGIPGESLLGFK